MFGGTGDESDYSEINPPFLSSDMEWLVVSINHNGDILQSNIYCHEEAIQQLNMGR